MSGEKILEGLRDAVKGNIARVTIDGVVWTRSDLLANMIAQERERCAKVAENPGFIEAWDTDWDEGVNHAKTFIANAIRNQK